MAALAMIMMLQMHLVFSEDLRWKFRGVDWGFDWFWQPCLMIFVARLKFLKHNPLVMKDSLSIVTQEFWDVLSSKGWHLKSTIPLEASLWMARNPQRLFGKSNNMIYMILGALGPPHPKRLKRPGRTWQLRWGSLGPSAFSIVDCDWRLAAQAGGLGGRDVAGRSIFHGAFTFNLHQAARIQTDVHCYVLIMASVLACRVGNHPHAFGKAGSSGKDISPLSLLTWWRFAKNQQLCGCQDPAAKPFAALFQKSVTLESKRISMQRTWTYKSRSWRVLPAPRSPLRQAPTPRPILIRASVSLPPLRPAQRATRMETSGGCAAVWNRDRSAVAAIHPCWLMISWGILLPQPGILYVYRWL